MPVFVGTRFVVRSAKSTAGSSPGLRPCSELQGLVVESGCFRGAGSAAPPSALYAALKRRSSTVVLAAVVVSSVSGSRARSTSRSKATDGSVRPTRPVVGIPWLVVLRAGIWDPSIAHDVHFVGVVLRSG
jgi:hypothetical protein